MPTIQNGDFIVTVTDEDGPIVVLEDEQSGFSLADGRYRYGVTLRESDTSVTYDGLQNPLIELEDETTLEISGDLAGLEVTHRLSVKGEGYEETISFTNPTGDSVSLANVACGLTRTLTPSVGELDPSLSDDRFIAVPFRHRADDPQDHDEEYSIEDLVTGSSREYRVGDPGAFAFGRVPTGRRESEAWIWDHADRTYLIAKYNDESIERSVLEPIVEGDQIGLRFGGVTTTGGKILRDSGLEPGAERTFGLTHIEARSGDFQSGYYAFREFLDDRGCRYPPDYDPPVHWNELYDNPEWFLVTENGRLYDPTTDVEPVDTRDLTYTREALEEEATKAERYHCDSLYLDPGWDTEFGTFRWDAERLDSADEFLCAVDEEYDLKVSLHCPLAPWMSQNGRGVDEWPGDGLRKDENGETTQEICLGSQAYLDEAEARLKDLCDSGVSFLMFDGTFWTGSCWNEEHDHPVPYTQEDQCDAAVELARRVHDSHPDVLIEMHDMVTGGSVHRFTPVYFRYSESSSYDENWGLELMWSPLEDVLDGRARSLYYYNLACNIPVYLHIDLRDDNEHCLAFWWYASTCRHLGIGGTHRDPQIAAAHRTAMKQYQDYREYYTRGEFFGTDNCREEVHFHVHPTDGSFVVNLFNLEDEVRTLSGSVSLETLGLSGGDYVFVQAGNHVAIGDGEIHWERRMEPYSADVIHIETLDFDSDP